MTPVEASGPPPAPAGAAWIPGGVCAPAGFRAGAAAAGIKRPGDPRKDCALIVSDRPATVAGVFTTNRVKAAPVSWTQGVCIREEARAIFVNSGNANACTGRQGVEDAQATAEAVALGLDIPITEVCVCSTGVIGQPMPMDRLLPGVKAAIADLRPDGGGDAAEAILTTDTVPKAFALEVALSGGTARLGGICKGSGMIAPNMATLLGFITTDAALDGIGLQLLLREAAGATFNRICVDNDMSTNDTVLCLANGASGLAPIAPGEEDFSRFAEALDALCLAMAQALVRDGEGATKFIAIEVLGAAHDAAAERIARAIATSQLCKTAFFGQDANWGRIACAAGYADAEFDPGRLSIAINGLEVVHDGLPTSYAEADAAERMKAPEITVRVHVGDGRGTCAFWTCDMSYDYVRINADYRT